LGAPLGGGRRLGLGVLSACDALPTSGGVAHAGVDVEVESAKTTSPPTWRAKCRSRGSASKKLLQNQGFELRGTWLSYLRPDHGYGVSAARPFTLTGHDGDAEATQVRATGRCNTLLLPALDIALESMWFGVHCVLGENGSIPLHGGGPAPFVVPWSSSTKILAGKGSHRAATKRGAGVLAYPD
jgi:hypothetical protein